MAQQKAKAAAARFVMEVAPPPVVSVMRRGKKVPRSLDTIAEDDSEHLVPAYGPSSSSSHHYHGFAAAWSSSRRVPGKARERAGGVMSELSITRCFSDAHGQQAAAAAGRVAITS